MSFIDELLGLAMMKTLGLKAGCTNKIRVKFIRNNGFLDVINNSSETLIFSKDEAI